jgi:hypothetical protein
MDIAFLRSTERKIRDKLEMIFLEKRLESKIC